MEHLYKINKEISLLGKWIQLTQIGPLLKLHASNYTVNKIGESFLKSPIHEIILGRGPIKILMWTQMHGNEATATKVVFDLLNLFANPKTPETYLNILKNCTIKIVPMLNPDGAKAYTRVNAQKIDLNRDATILLAPESKLLRKVLLDFNPDYCFNLHDQRNFYSVAQTKEPASISFLSPATEVSRKLTPERIKSMAVISSMYEAIKTDIPKNVSIYNDEFYPKATGDNFQKEGFTTILIEAGHIKDDYNREKVRYFYFKSLLTGLYHISSQYFADDKLYQQIPQNDTCYLDIIIKNVMLNQDSSYKKVEVGILFIEEIKENKLIRMPTIIQSGNLSKYGANKFIDAKGVKINNLNKLLLIMDNLN